MNQEKIGRFLKQLRMEKQLTQEKLSETLGVSRRTVSRWETGNNLPDLSILVELADFYDVDLKEIFAGERNQNMMNEEEKDTLKQAAAYTERRKKKNMRRMHILFIIGCISMACYLLILFFGPEQSTPLSDFFKGGVTWGFCRDDCRWNNHDFITCRCHCCLENRSRNHSVNCPAMNCQA